MKKKVNEKMYVISVDFSNEEIEKLAELGGKLIQKDKVALASYACEEILKLLVEEHGRLVNPDLRLAAKRKKSRIK
jgi:hypothetical protein